MFVMQSFFVDDADSKDNWVEGLEHPSQNWLGFRWRGLWAAADSTCLEIN